MTVTRTRLEDRHDLIERLVKEFSGTVPPSDVLDAVLRADRALPLVDLDDQPDRLRMCESLARSMLAAA